MQLDLTLFAGFAALVVGSIAFWSNPQRAINRVFLTLSIHEALWLLALHNTIYSDDHLPWMRALLAIGAFIPFHLWLVKETIVVGERVRVMLWRARWWFLGCAALASITPTHWLIPEYSSQEHPARGPGFYLYLVGIVVAYLTVTGRAVFQMRRQTGVRKVELQTLLVAGGCAALTVVILMVLGSWLKMPWLIRLQPLVVLIFHTGTVISITTYRIFDARQVLRFCVQKAVLVALVALEAYFVHAIFVLYLPEALAFIASTGLSLWFTVTLNNWLNRRFQYYSQSTDAREAAFKAAQAESRAEKLESAFISILKGWGKTDRVVLFSGSKDYLVSGSEQIPINSPAIVALAELHWATPESLEREKSTAERKDLNALLSEYGLGAAVLLKGPSLTVFLGVGSPVSRQPVTYPQIQQLIELASIFGGALERAHLSSKAQRAEQLATVGLLGAGFAHEIRNPLVSIKTFVQLLPRHYNDPAFRDKFFRLIGDEVMRIERLTEQLLDLASPRAYLPQIVELHPILRSSLDLVTAKATDKNVKIIAEFQASPELVYTDPSAARQVLLNLCFNAIQAIEDQEGDRWVIVSTQNLSDGIEMAVSDNGPGIAEGIRTKLFEPFQTTRSTGFGLGLAICVDILASLNATLNVDPQTPGLGATFRVKFPCQPS